MIPVEKPDPGATILDGSARLLLRGMIDMSNNRWRDAVVIRVVQRCLVLLGLTFLAGCESTYGFWVSSHSNLVRVSASSTADDWHPLQKVPGPSPWRKHVFFLGRSAPTSWPSFLLVEDGTRSVVLSRTDTGYVWQEESIELRLEYAKGIGMSSVEGKPILGFPLASEQLGISIDGYVLVFDLWD